MTPFEGLFQHQIFLSWWPVVNISIELYGFLKTNCHFLFCSVLAVNRMYVKMQVVYSIESSIISTTTTDSKSNYLKEIFLKKKSFVLIKEPFCHFKLLRLFGSMDIISQNRIIYSICI